MNIRTFATLSALLLLSLAAPRLTAAQAGGQSASGSYRFALEDGHSKYVEFDATNQSDGSATGRMFYSDDATIEYKDLDGAGETEARYDGFSIQVEFDTLTVDKNQAVMSGTIRESNIKDLIGQRVLLTVEDNGDNTRVPDKLTWGIYKPVERRWTPSDAERKEDEGVGARWIATDAERKDDTGVQMPKDETISTKSFPISSYSLVDVESGAGDILVKP